MELSTFISIILVTIYCGKVISSPSNITMSSEFPDYPLNITWTTPENCNGEIFYYILFVKDVKNQNCLTWMRINCSNCENENPRNDSEVNILNNCTKVITNQTFTKDQNLIIVPIKSSGILPYTMYEINIIPVNTSGECQTLSMSERTAQYISEPVTNMSLTSHFPQYPLNITWKEPRSPNGIIIQYVIYVKEIVENKCVLWLTINCSDCLNMISEKDQLNISSRGCPSDTENNRIFERNQTIFTETISSPNILPYSDYSISIIPVNGYGPGEEYSLHIKTAEYVSEPVTNMSLTSHFPQYPLNITWKEPRRPNGIIIQYVIYVKEIDENKCVLWLTINCSDCLNMISEKDQLNMSSRGCPSNTENSRIFERNQTIFTETISSPNILPYSDYSVSIIPVNGYGPGEEYSLHIKTAEYVSHSVRNLTLFSHFPDQPLSVNWVLPLNPRGMIIQYIIMVHRYDFNKTCLLWWSVNCIDCGNQSSAKNGHNPEYNTCLEMGNSDSFLKNETTFNKVTNHKSILPYMKYEVAVIPVNRYGFGNGSYDSIYTSQYKSSSVNNLTLTSNFPKDNLVIHWKPPSSPRGKINNYYIFVYTYTTNICLVFINLTCSDCNQTLGISENNEFKDFHCSLNNNYLATFSKNNESLLFSITNPIIQPEHNYTVYIVPVNGYGWGENTSQSIHTPLYKPIKVSSFFSTVSESNILMSWASPTEDLYNFTYKIIITSDFNSSIYNFPHSETNFTLTTSDFCTSFDMCIWIWTPYGNSDLSCITNITGPSVVTTDYLYLEPIKNTIKATWNISGQSRCLVSFTVSWNNMDKETYSKDMLIKDLLYYTSYNVTVIPSSRTNNTSSKRTGISKSRLIITEIGYPTEVRNFQCVNVTFNEFRCSWSEPINPNGPLLTYNLECQGGKVNQKIFTNLFYESISENVVPEVQYVCIIRANTSAGFGNQVSTKILIEPSNIPDIINMSEIPGVMSRFVKESTTTEIYVTLPYSHFTERFGHITKFSLIIVVKDKGSITISSNKPFEKPYSECDKGNLCPYEILLKDSTSNIRKKRESNLQQWKNENYKIGSGENCETKGQNYCNGALSSNTEYIIGFRAYTSKGFYTVGLILKSTLYNSLAISLAIPFVFILLIFFIIVGFIMYRRKYYYRDTEITISSPKDDTINYLRPEIRAYENYYKSILKDSCMKASQQYSDLTIKWKELEIEKKLIYVLGNEKKNRYKNILPYEHNMVKLKGPEDYINASRICSKHFSININDQCTCTNVYIATQGPIGNSSEKHVSTIGDFWRMALENNVRIIVNLTQCVESFKDKCAQYWPEVVYQKETFVSGGHNIEVTLQTVVTTNVFEERIFTVIMDGQERCIIQLHFTTWFDHGCPDFNNFLKFYDRFNTLRRNDDSVIVHCSAGVGRTGTFILIDMELRKISLTDERIEIYNTLFNLRQSRCFMVQTEKQYIFIHDVLYQYLKQANLLQKKGKLSWHRKNFENRTSYDNPAFG